MAKLMRIALTTPTFPPHNSGLGNVVEKYAIELSLKGHSVDVLTSKPSDHTIKCDAELPFSVVRFDCRGSFALHNMIRGNILTYIKFLKSNHYDAILCHAAQNWASELALLFGNSKIKIYHSHCVSSKELIDFSARDFIRYACWIPYNLFQRRLLRKADGCVFLGTGDTGPRCIDKRMLSDLPFTILPNPPSYQPTTRKESRPVSLNTDALIFLSVGSMDYLKGHDRILKSLSLLRTRREIVLKIYCQQQTAFRVQLERIAMELPENVKVEFNTGIAGEQLYDAYIGADLFLYGSRTECYPLVLADCIPSNLDFIAFEAGYIKEIPGGTTVKTETEMAEKIDAWISDLEKGKNKKERASSYSCVQPMTWKGNTDLLVEFIETLLLAK